jgi:spore germination protein
MLRTILITALTLTGAGLGYWGYQEHQEKNAVLQHAENNYQRAFHELTYDMDLLNDKIGTTLAMNSRDQLSPALAEVWRLTSEAHSNVGQLPLTLLPFNKTEEFLANIGKFSYQTAIRDLSKEPLSDKEYETLKALYKTSGDIQNELRKVQHLVIENNLRWMDVELALATNEKQADNTIIDGFKTVEKNVESYAEADFGPSFTSAEKQNQGFSQLKGREVDANVAKEVARSFLGLKGNEDIRVTENGEGSDYGFYSLTIKAPGEKHETYMDITKKGGYPVWVIQNKEVAKRKISLNEAALQAEKFLKDHQFESLDLYESAQYDNTGVFTFVGTQEGVRIYPDSVRMKISLEDGKVLAFSARDFLMAHKLRNIPAAVLSKEEARAKINRKVKIMEDRLAIIINDLKEEVLCYEFLGTINNDTYRIFINAENGYEEKVEKLQNAEQVYDQV